MNALQIDLVQGTFSRALRIGPHLAATFYNELFAIDPSLRRLFNGDMIAQNQKLLDALSYVVEGLRDFSGILPAVQALAVRHLEYGVEARHYATVGTALLRTLRHELGAEFTSEARAAWAAAYKLLSDAMIVAAYGNDQRLAL